MLELGFWKLSDNPLMPQAPESARRMYTAVILCEILAIAALWLLGRAYA